MSIDKIGQTNNINPYNSKTVKTPIVKKVEIDSVNVSAEAKRSIDFSQATETIKKTADIRIDRVNEVKAKYNKPDYISDDVLEQTAEKLMQELGL